MTTAADLMTREVISVSPETPVAEVADIILNKRVSALPVVDDDGRLLGIVSEGDLIRSADSQRDAHRSWWLVLLTPVKAEIDSFLGDAGRRVRDVMSRDVLMAREDEPLKHLITLLARSRIKRIPIVTDGKLMGIVSRVDVLRHLADTLARTGHIE